MDTDPTNFNITLSAGAENAADITVVEGINGTGTIDGSALTEINGTAAQVVQAPTDLDTDPTNFNSTLTGVAAADDIKTIEEANGTGTIDGSALTEINGTAACVVQALNDLDTDPDYFNSTVNGVAASSDIALIRRACRPGTINGSALTEINGTAADVVEAYGDLDVKPTNFTSTITGEAVATHISQIETDNGTGTIDGLALTDIIWYYY